MSDHLHVVFRQFDLDGSGTINSEELQVLFAAIGIEVCAGTTLLSLLNF